MRQIANKFISIRNVAIKTILAFIGIVMVVASVYPIVMRFFFLTEKVIAWSNTNWVLLISGFVLAVAASKYNTIVDAIINKFK